MFSSYGCGETMSRGFEDWTYEDVLKHNARINKDASKIDFNTKDNKLHTEKRKSKYGAKIRLEIPIKLQSLNDYIKACRSNKYMGAKMKKEIEEELSIYINKLPKFDRPIRINFIWVEENKKRDLDNICFAKKFILDAMQEYGKLANDNRKWVTGFTDSFELGNEYKVILEIEEV
jgi:hypothetical protein